jgi:U3 small nucleolar RNA-associated protein MPP10
MAPDTGAAAASAEGAGAIDAFRREVGRGATAFLSKSDERAAAARGAAKALFAQLSSSLAANGLDLPLPELHTDGLDAEQVWMQIEMQLEPLLGKAKGALRRLRPAISAGDELTAERLLRLPANAQGEASGSDEEAPEWEPFEEGVEYDVDGEEEDDEEEDDEEEEEEDPGGSGKKQRDLTSKLFKNPGMFNLTEMENFSLQAEAEEEARLEREERRERRRKARESGDGDDESESESEENVLDAEEDEEDEEDESDASGSGSEDDDDMADLIGDAARLAGVAGPKTRAAKAKARLGERAAMKKKGKDLMFSDFFGDNLSGARSGGKSRRGDDDDDDEASDREEDLFAAMERGEMESAEEASSDEDEGVDALDQQDEDALREELQRELADELAAEEEEDDDAAGGGFDGFDDAEAEEEEEEAEEKDLSSDDEAKEKEKELSSAAAAAALASRRDYAPSAFQRAQDALKRQIKTLEARALEEKTWLLKGEASAKERPKNSVLEADVEFDHVAAPPPAVSEEMTARLEDIIKARIVEQRFDDVERVEPSTRDDRGRRQLTELDDTKSKKGLGDIYADDYVAQKHLAKTGARLDEEKEEPIVVEARALFAALATKLDALSNFHFAPKPVVEEMQIKTDAPALQVEEVAPLMVSEASRKAPEEVFAGGEGAGGARGSAAGDVKADAELTKEDRKAARAKRKRKAKAVGNERERVKAKREREKEAKEKAAEDAGFTRKAPKVAMLAAAPAGGRSKSAFSKSSKVFGMLQEAKEADALGRGKPKKSDGMKNKAALKL